MNDKLLNELGKTLNEIAKNQAEMALQIAGMKSATERRDTPAPQSVAREVKPPNTPSGEWVKDSMLGALGKSGPLSVAQLAATLNISSAWAWHYIWELESEKRLWIRKTRTDEGKDVYYLYHADSIIAA